MKNKKTAAPAEKNYELTQAVFSAWDQRDNQDVCVIKYVRLVGGISRGRAIEILHDQIKQRYQSVKFRFWCDTWTSDGGQPQELGGK